jgi:hypothetical protein
MNIGWLEYCKWCQRKHVMIQRPCPSCGVYFTSQPKSDKVMENCGAHYDCDGCDAYAEHIRV